MNHLAHGHHSSNFIEVLISSCSRWGFKNTDAMMENWKEQTLNGAQKRSYVTGDLLLYDLSSPQIRRTVQRKLSAMLFLFSFFFFSWQTCQFACFVCFLYDHVAPAFYLMPIAHPQAQLFASDGENKTPREGLSNGLLRAPMSRTFRRSGICWVAPALLYIPHEQQNDGGFSPYRNNCVSSDKWFAEEFSGYLYTFFFLQSAMGRDGLKTLGFSW